MDDYGKELILDLHGCDPSKFSRESLAVFFRDLCVAIDMEASDLHFWDDVDEPPAERETEPHLIGTSAIQFIRTSNITIHTLDVLRRVYVNIFSCKDFDSDVVAAFCVQSFGGDVVNRQEFDRK